MLLSIVKNINYTLIFYVTIVLYLLYLNKIRLWFTFCCILCNDSQDFIEHLFYDCVLIHKKNHNEIPIWDLSTTKLKNWFLIFFLTKNCISISSFLGFIHLLGYLEFKKQQTFSEWKIMYAQRTLLLMTYLRPAWYDP